MGYEDFKKQTRCINRVGLKLYKAYRFARRHKTALRRVSAFLIVLLEYSLAMFIDRRK